MTGTVVVAAAGGSAPSTPDSPDATAPAATDTSTGNLPLTGFELLAVVLVGTVMTGSGILLRRLAAGIRAAFSPRG
jgi:hypothetical protein